MLNKKNNKFGPRRLYKFLKKLLDQNEPSIMVVISVKEYMMLILHIKNLRTMLQSSICFPW